MNDMYGHANNIWYYAFFDTVINHFLIEQCGLRPTKSAAVGLCVESGCKFFKSVEYPCVVEAGLYVSHTGRSSIRYEVGIFEKGKEEIAAHGHFVHVFVDAQVSLLPLPFTLICNRLTS
jgi:acyl-CoA thioester hydrolase